MLNLLLNLPAKNSKKTKMYYTQKFFFFFFENFIAER